MLPRHLKEDYERNLEKIISNDDNFRYPRECVVKPTDILKAHYLICDYFESNNNITSLYGVKSINLLCSAVGRQVTGSNVVLKWKSPLDRCATLFYGLIKNHPFHDGNKRTAFLATLLYLSRIGLLPYKGQKEFEDLTIAIASNSLNKSIYYSKFKNDPDAEVLTISRTLKSLTRKTDKRYYALTYKEFNHKIKSYGFILDKPSKGYIVLYKKVKNLFGQDKDIYLMQIGFPGWSKQINEKATKCVINAIKENTDGRLELDSQIFFKDGDPLYKLIENYEKLLLRLQDK